MTADQNLGLLAVIDTARYWTALDLPLTLAGNQFLAKLAVKHGINNLAHSLPRGLALEVIGKHSLYVCS